MGLLIDGVWHDQWYETSKSGGRFVRQESAFRDRVTADGSSGFRAASGRYHLYVSYACPWAHRTLIYRQLKGLHDHISISVVNPLMLDQGWSFEPAAGVVPDPVMNARHLHEIYTLAKPDYSGRVTAPVLWDLETGTIVNNESAEIIRMLDREFGAAGAVGPLLCPPGLQAEIDELNVWIYERINNGVYRAGFATTQKAYDEAVIALFDALDRLEERLGSNRYLLGNRLSEADLRLFTTLIRFDPVYVGHFKCNLRRLADYPQLWGYTRELAQIPGIDETIRMDHIKAHYYRSHPTINPSGVVPIGPEIDFAAPHHRGEIGSAGRRTLVAV